MARKLRSALELVSAIGSLGFDLHHHSKKDIDAAVTLLWSVNPDLFCWLVDALEQPPSVGAVDPHASSTGTPSTREKETA